MGDHGCDVAERLLFQGAFVPRLEAGKLLRAEDQADAR
jgi:hypothetical protein